MDLGWLTICSFTVLPSSSIVRIFCQSVSGVSLDGVITRAYEVNTDCGDVGLGVSVVGESQEQAGLSDTGVSDEEQLEEVVVSGPCQ